MSKNFELEIEKENPKNDCYQELRNFLFENIDSIWRINIYSPEYKGSKNSKLNSCLSQRLADDLENQGIHYIRLQDVTNEFQNPFFIFNVSYSSLRMILKDKYMQESIITGKKIIEESGIIGFSFNSGFHSNKFFFGTGEYKIPDEFMPEIPFFDQEWKNRNHNKVNLFNETFKITFPDTPEVQEIFKEIEHAKQGLNKKGYSGKHYGLMEGLIKENLFKLRDYLEIFYLTKKQI